MKPETREIEERTKATFRDIQDYVDLCRDMIARQLSAADMRRETEAFCEKRWGKLESESLNDVVDRVFSGLFADLHALKPQATVWN